MRIGRYLLFLIPVVLSGCTERTYILVENDSEHQREEVVEVNVEDVIGKVGPSFVITDSNGKELQYQITNDGKLLLMARLDANSTVEYEVRKGNPAPVDTVCTAVFRSDCQDDLSWENDRGGYRLYGPRYKREGGKVYGYDIWTKSVSYPVLSKRYDDALYHGKSYHKDHGDGFDGYTVGPTLGAGMNALVDSNGDILYQVAYKDYEILDQGPLRLKVKFVIDTLDIPNGNPLVETRIVTLDKGSWLNRCEVVYENLDKNTPMVCGIVIHNDNKDYVVDDEYGILSYKDLTDDISAGNGEIYVGVLNLKADSSAYYPFKETVANSDGQILSYATVKPGKPYVYYWGAGWSKSAPNSFEDWNKYLRESAEDISDPLKVTIK